MWTLRELKGFLNTIPEDKLDNQVTIFDTLGVPRKLLEVEFVHDKISNPAICEASHFYFHLSP